MTENLKSELDYLKTKVPDVSLEETPKFTDEINTEIFSRVYGKVQELVIEKEPELTEEKEHISFTDANVDIFDTIKNEELPRIFTETVFENQNYMDTLYTLAKEENANAQNIVGICLYTGYNCEFNKDLGMDYLERAIEQNHTVAMRNLAIALENINAERSLELYKRAAKLGDKVAKVNLDYMQDKVNKKDLDRILSLKNRVQDDPKEKTTNERARDER